MQEQLKLNSKHLQFCVDFQYERKHQHFWKPAKYILRQSGRNIPDTQFYIAVFNRGCASKSSGEPEKQKSQWPTSGICINPSGEGLPDAGKFLKHSKDSTIGRQSWEPLL